MENTEQYWKINKKWPKRIFWFIFALSLLCARLLPGYGNYTNRARVSEVLVLLQAPRMSVEEQLKKNPNSKVILDVNGGVKVYRWGGAKVYQSARDGLMLFCRKCGLGAARNTSVAR